MRILTISLTFALVTLGAQQYKLIPDVEYSRPGGFSLKLDAHIPPGDGPFPAVVLVHGGGWSAGDKAGKFIQPLFGPLNETGFAWFSINYRLAPQFSYPAPAEDLEAAVRFVKQHAKEYKVNPARIALMGESAGGHLVNVVGAKNDVGVAAVVCFYGPIDLVEWSKRLEGKPLSPSVQAFFRMTTLDETGRAHIREASPRIYLNSKTPPFLVIHGTRDEAVSYSQALLTVELLKKRGIPCELITIPDGVHGVMNWEKDPRFQIYKAPMVAWLQKTLR
ncbi:MAG: alpha/beta hydrolase [Bryobacteraceae bacterium]